tara:strand:+ start:362 stop:577 length:216 start_codon:yes stop_codon:yes gene_type:complete
MPVSKHRINAIFKELFGRDAESEGTRYWVGEVKAGKVPESDLRGAILHSAWTADPSSQGADMKHYRSIEAT